MNYNNPNITVSVPFRATRFWLTAIIFISCNVVFPQLCHLVPGGGPTWLPIYFFTLVAAWRYGLKIGLITAVASPVVNYILFGMPSADTIAPVLLKSVILATAGATFSARYDKATLALILCTVLTYQVAGTLGEWALCGDFSIATQDFRMGVPGMTLQIFGAYVVLHLLARK